MLSKQRTWQILEARAGDPVSRAFNAFMLVLIVLNVVAVALGTVQEVASRWHMVLEYFEWGSIGVFSVEYLARIWAAPADPRYAAAATGRLRYAVTPMAIVDLIAILPAYLTFLGVDLRIARALRLLRVFRVAKLGRYVSALRLMGNVLRSKREELVVSSFVLALLLVLSSSLIYFAEHAVQPEAFSSIPAAMWWAISTLTTVGYGDVYPVTSVGRIIASGAAILGIGLFALPTAILGSGFLEELQRQKQPRLCPHCGKAIPDGRLTDR